MAGNIAKIVAVYWLIKQPSKFLWGLTSYTNHSNKLSILVIVSILSYEIMPHSKSKYLAHIPHKTAHISKPKQTNWSSKHTLC